MLFLEEWARPLLIVHAVSAAVLVGASTHHLLWSWRYRRGRFVRMRQERLFALITAVAFVLTFFLGNLLYPTYKVRVRAEFFDSPQAVAAEAAQRRDERVRQGTLAPVDGTDGDPEPAPSYDLSWVGRLFDVKEHWVALGCAASLLLLLLSRAAHPSTDRRLLPAYLGLSAVVCATAWTGAVIGLITTSFRSVAGA